MKIIINLKTKQNEIEKNVHNKNVKWKFFSFLLKKIVAMANATKRSFFPTKEKILPQNFFLEKKGKSA